MEINIGRLIEEERRHQGMSHTKMARLINTTRSNVNNIEKRHSIDTELLKRISRALKTNFFALLAKDLKTLDTEVLGLGDVVLSSRHDLGTFSVHYSFSTFLRENLQKSQKVKSACYPHRQRPVVLTSAQQHDSSCRKAELWVICWAGSQEPWAEAKGCGLGAARFGKYLGLFVV